MKHLTPLLLLVAVLFNGCGNTNAPIPKQQNQKAKLPTWYLNPPKDTLHYIYGVGSAHNRDGAVKAALVDMISKLGISIESTMQTKQESFGKYYAHSINKSEIKSKVSQIKINNYETLNAKRISYRQFIVLLKTDRSKFANGLKKEIDLKLAELEKRYKMILQSDRIQRYNTLKQIEKEAKELLFSIYILSELKKEINEKSYIQRVKKLQDAFSIEKSTLLFALHITHKQASIFAKHTANYLAKNGLHIGNAKRALHIYLDTSNTIADSAIGRIGIIKVNVKVYDGNTFVGGSNRVYKVRLNGSQESLYRRAAIEFSKDLEKEGLKEVLGINLGL